MHEYWQSLIPDYISDDLSETERHTLEAHLKSCSECRQVLAEWRIIARVTHKKTKARNRPLPPLRNRLDGTNHSESQLSAKPVIKEEIDMTTLRIRQQKSYGIPWTAAAVLILTFFFSLLLLGGLDLLPTPLPLQQGQGLGDIPEDPIALFQLYVDEIWNKQNMEAIPLLLSENHVHHDASMSEDIVGLEAFAEYVAFEHDILPDVTFTVDNLVANGNDVIGRVTMTYEAFEKTVLVNATINEGKLSEVWFDVGTMVEAYNLDLAARYDELLDDIDNVSVDDLREFYPATHIWHAYHDTKQYGLSAGQIFSNLRRDLKFCPNIEQDNQIYAVNDLIIEHIISSCMFKNSWSLDITLQPTGEPVDREHVYITRIQEGQFAESWWFLDDPIIWARAALLLEANNGSDFPQTQAIFNVNSGQNKNRALTQHYVDGIWNAEELDTATFEEVYAFRTSFAYNVDDVDNRVSMLELHSAIKQAFPDATLEVTRMVTDSSDIMILFTWTGTHTATFEYGDIVLPATNEVVTTKGVIVLEIFTVQNKVVRETWYADFPFLAELEQIAEG